MIDTHLYVIIWGAYVRIGAAVDPIDRLTRVSETRPPRVVGSPELIGAVPGGYGAESWLTAVLSGHRVGNGWYHLRGPLLDLVEAATRAGVEDLAPRASRTPVRMRSGDALFAVTSTRGEPETRRRHVMLLPLASPPGLRLVTPQPSLCGAGASLVIGRFSEATVHTCDECRRCVPARWSQP